MNSFRSSPHTHSLWLWRSDMGSRYIYSNQQRANSLDRRGNLCVVEKNEFCSSGAVVVAARGEGGELNFFFVFSKFYVTEPNERKFFFFLLLLLFLKPTISVTRCQWPRGPRPLTFWDCGLDTHRGHGCLSVVKVVCCQVEVSATSWSLVQRSPTDCVASLCVI